MSVAEIMSDEGYGDPWTWNDERAGAIEQLEDTDSPCNVQDDSVSDMHALARVAALETLECSEGMVYGLLNRADALDEIAHLLGGDKAHAFTAEGVVGMVKAYVSTVKRKGSATSEA